ncbi:glycosyltransferase [Natronococcus occultus]|uniref:Glycosyltransferase n=1 Tax=Natronococcus occultus SP4 TaxID=694430 RepID=L0K3U0_9EURY|nr:glycosyltransferase [Natronococcus occultus]AGB38768.1 glycosyltransferase [Natronococcus occultus SP4]
MKVLNLVTTSNSAHYQEQLRALNRNNIEQDILSSHETGISPDSSIIANLPSGLKQVLYYGATTTSYYPNVLKHSMKTGEYDLLHATSGLVAPFALAQPIRPIVVTLWGSDLMGNYFAGHYDRVCEYCASKADATIVMSQEMNEQLDQDVYVIPHGIDLEKFKPISKDEAQRELGWNSKKKHVLFPYSKSRSVKRYPLAKEIVDEVNERTEKVVELHTISGEPHSKIPIYMNASDCLLLTSKHEGSPNTVKEAMACNLPVVSINVGDVEERLSGVYPSKVCDKESELADCLENTLDKDMRSNGRDHIQDLSLKKMGEQIVEVYKSVQK